MDATFCSLYRGQLISVQAVVFKALAVIFRNLFYLYFTKGISLQRTYKRSVPNLNVRNPILRGYKRISCPAVESLLLKCFSFLVCNTALATLASEGPCLSSPRRDRVGHGRRCSAEGDGLGVRGDSWPSGSSSVPKPVERSVTTLQGQLTQLGVRDHNIQGNTDRLFVEPSNYNTGTLNVVSLSCCKRRESSGGFGLTNFPFEQSFCLGSAALYG